MSFDIDASLRKFQPLQHTATQVLAAPNDDIPDKLPAFLEELKKTVPTLLKLLEYAEIIQQRDLAAGNDIRSKIAYVAKPIIEIAIFLETSELDEANQDFLQSLRELKLIQAQEEITLTESSWQRMHALIMTRPENHDYPDLNTPFIFWYVAYRMNQIFTLGDPFQSHFIDWLVPHHYELLYYDTMHTLIDILIKNQSHDARIKQLLFIVNLNDSDEESYKHQERLDYSVERALYHGNITNVTALTQSLLLIDNKRLNAETKTALMVTPEAKLVGKLPKEPQKVLHCMHIAIASNNDKAIDLFINRYGIEVFYEASMTYPSLTLARFFLSRHHPEKPLNFLQAKHLAKLAARIGDIKFLNQLLKHCEKNVVNKLFEEIIKPNFIPSRNPRKLFLTPDRRDIYRKNQRCYVDLFMETSMLIASYMMDEEFTFDIDEELKPNLRFVGRCRRAMAFAVHSDQYSVTYGTPRFEELNTRRMPIYDEYFEVCNTYIEDAEFDDTSEFSKVEDLLNIRVYTKKTSHTVMLGTDQIDLPITEYISSNTNKNKICEIWQHPTCDLLPSYRALAQEEFDKLGSNPVDYLQRVLRIYYFNAQGLLWQLGTAACNDMMTLHAMLYRAKMLLPYEGIGRHDCLAYSHVNVDEFIEAWPKILGLNSIEECAEFLTRQYQRHIKSGHIELTAEGTVRFIQSESAVLIAKHEKSDAASPLLTHIVVSRVK